MTISSDRIAEKLEANGFLKSVAGEDFDRAVRALSLMFENDRGLLVIGDAGCGKTQLMRALRKWLNPNTSLQWFYCKEPEDILCLRQSDEVLLSNVYVDDIGCEEIVREFGNTVDVVGDFVQRYHYRGKGRFIGSSNLHSKQLNERYGTRFVDRLMEMCVVLSMSGLSKREGIVVK